MRISSVPLWIGGLTPNATTVSALGEEQAFSIWYFFIFLNEQRLAETEVVVFLQDLKNKILANAIKG